MMDGTVAKLIMDSLENNSDFELKGTIGEVFKNYIRTVKQKDIDKNIIKTAEEEELAVKLRHLKQCELNHDLGWFDYDSWNSLPLLLRETFTKTIDHLFYGGVFFQYSKLTEIENTIWCHLSLSNTITVINDCDNYHLLSMGEGDGKYAKLGIKALMNLQEEISHKTIRIIGKTSTGVVVSKYKGKKE